MRQSVLLLFVVVAFLVPQGAIAAAEDQPPAPGPGQLITVPPSPVVTGQAPGQNPMIEEIRALLAESAATVLEIQNQMKAAPDEQTALAMLRQVRQHKQDTEVAVLRIQQRYAREKGDTEAAQLIEEAIGQLLIPAPVSATPEARAERARRRGGVDHD
jgi:hypothetical protein